MTHHLVVGTGVTGLAVVRALRSRGTEVVAVDDRPDDSLRDVLTGLGVPFFEAPSRDELARLVAAAEVVLPAPGLPDWHPVFEAARSVGLEVSSEFDLAEAWDDRPLVAVTGTDGKTTVTSMIVAILEASGIHADAVGNTEVPLVEAIDDPTIDVFVVEASSFRLGRSRHFAPAVGTWLNFAPDHLDVHADLEGYEAAKARLWDQQRPDQVAIGNLDDPVVARRLQLAPARHIGFGTGGDYEVDRDQLVGPRRESIIVVADLPRALPHDLSNALAAAASAIEAGATVAAVGEALATFQGLPHRIQFVAERGGVRWYDDSKATVPHAAVTAASAFDSVVLLAGGRNKGLDLGELAQAAPHIRAVVAFGEAAPEVEKAFHGLRPVSLAVDIDEAVELAGRLATQGDVVLLSPACASFDQFRSYGERGDAFQAAVHALLGGAA